MAETSPWIAIVDDDPAVLRALSRLLRSRAFRVKTYGSGQEFLAALPDGLPECLIVGFADARDWFGASAASYKQRYSYSGDPSSPHMAMLRYTRHRPRYVCSPAAETVA